MAKSLSDSISQLELKVNGKTLILFNNRQIDTYVYDDIYDPDKPASGKYIPTVGSIVNWNGTLWYVATKDPTTYKCTLKPFVIVQTDDSLSQQVKIISYGNDKYCLYQDRRTSPYKLIVDAKLLFYGNNLVEYALYKTTSDNSEDCISMYLDATDKFISNRIPMQRVADEYAVYKWPTNCHTTKDLIEGEPILMRVFNNLGNVAAEVTLFVRNAVWNNDLNSHTNPIVGIGATCLQMIGEDFYIYPKQDPSHLNIQPYLKYADGTRQIVPIDNIRMFMYGMDDFMPTYPGHSQLLLFKYFLSRREQATNPSTISGTQFVTCIKNLIVISNDNDYDVKITTIPLFNKEVQAWHLRFFAYTDRRNAVYDVTDYVKYREGYEFHGDHTYWGMQQNIEIEYDLQGIFHSDNPIPGTQSIFITVWDPKTYERYTIKDKVEDDHVYGADGSIVRRPILCYDEEIKQYFIPTSIFRSWNNVVESFYHLARPPYNYRSETNAPTPTHFTVRDPYTGRMIIGGPVPADSYGQAWPMFMVTDTYLYNSIIIEFLQDINGTFNILYGVPVDVRPGTFNSEDNQLYPINKNLLSH